MFNCFLIGENRLMIQCAEILMENGFSILGIISDFIEIEHYAIKKHIHFFKSLKEAEHTIFANKIDYFFSVVNHKILPNKIIEYIKKLTINYHDAILPGYAGVNATCWAILNDEKQHGITWHIVNEVVDGGDILKQAVFPIEKEETALSLNLKCHQYAINLFSELVTELKNETCIRIPQNFEKRTYYSIYEKPPGNGWINWGDESEKIKRQFRASYLGNYTNPFSCLKFILENQSYIVSKLLISSEISNKKPGTVVDIRDGSWKISTKTDVLIITEITTIEGRPIDLRIIEKHFNIKPGYCLKNPSTTELYSFQNLSSELFFYERYWAKKLKNYNDPNNLDHQNFKI